MKIERSRASEQPGRATKIRSTLEEHEARRAEEETVLDICEEAGLEVRPPEVAVGSGKAGATPGVGADTMVRAIVSTTENYRRTPTVHGGGVELDGLKYEIRVSRCDPKRRDPTTPNEGTIYMEMRISGNSAEFAREAVSFCGRHKGEKYGPDARITLRRGDPWLKDFGGVKKRPHRRGLNGTECVLCLTEEPALLFMVRKNDTLTGAEMSHFFAAAERYSEEFVRSLYA